MLRDRDAEDAPAGSATGSRESLPFGMRLGWDEEEAGKDEDVSRSGGTASALSCSCIQ